MLICRAPLRKRPNGMFSLRTLRGFYAMNVNRTVRSFIKIRFISAWQKLTTNERSGRQNKVFNFL